MSDLILFTKIISLSNFLMGVFFIIIILSAGFFVACQSLNKNIKSISRPLAAALKFSVIFIVVGFLFQYYFRIHVFDIITKNIESEGVEVALNGHVMDREFNEILKNSIRDRFQSKTKGSHPTVKFVVRLQSQEDEVHFTLGKDSKDPELYWLSIPDSGFKGEITFIRLNIDIHDGK